MVRQPAKLLVITPSPNPPSPSPPPPSPSPPPPPYTCNNPLASRCDLEALQKFKSSLSAEAQSKLGSWSGDDPCSGWAGVLCGDVGGGFQRVTGINLGKGLFVYNKQANYWIFEEGAKSENDTK
eukprot:TRINITY_DN111981_c0_g1_i1.p1 TRINITY_DN111981_c0_g1~~TRINITY_DN111981_c0_g1_i1.p1  ORF type:complete len:124 (-),score=24.96 TRINITY_DN111981_c0_g1_i1:5-376(-)